MSVARLQVARIGRLHNVCAEIRLAFAMGTHVHFAAVVGRTVYSNNMPEELLVMLCDHIRFAP